MGRWGVLLPLVVALIAVACSNKHNAATPSPALPSATATRVPTSAPSSATNATAAPVVTTAASTPASSRTAGSPSATATSAVSQADAQLVSALLESSDLPSSLKQNARQPLSNRDFAAAQPANVAATFEQQLNASGRIGGAILNCSLPPGTQPDPNADQLASVIIILSRYNNAQQASAALSSLVQLVKPTVIDPRVFQVTETPAAIGQFGDETTAKLFKTSAILGGAPDSNVYAVGVRRGTIDELYVITGAGINPSVDAVRGIVSKQDEKIARLHL